MQNIQFGINVNTTQARQALRQFGTDIDNASKGFADGFNKSLSDSPIGGFIDGLKKMTTGAKGFGNVMGGVAVKGLEAFAVAATASAVALTAFTVTSVKSATELKKLSDATGVEETTLSKLSTMIVKSGGDMERVGDMATDFADKFGDARMGNTGFAESLTKLGVNLKGSTTDALNQAIKGLGEMENKAEATKIGMELFADAYKDIAATVANGGTIMAQQSMFSPQFIGASAELSANINSLKGDFIRLGVEAITPIVETVRDLIVEFTSPDLSGESPLTRTMREFKIWVGRATENVNLLLGALSGKTVMSTERMPTASEAVESNTANTAYALANVKSLEKAVSEAQQTKLQYEQAYSAETLKNEAEYIKAVKALDMENSESAAKRLFYARKEYAYNKQISEGNVAQIKSEADLKAKAEQDRLDAANKANDALIAQRKAQADADAENARRQAEYNALLLQAKSIADGARKAVLSETLEGRIKLLQEEEAQKIATVQRVHDREINNAKTIENIRLETERKIKAEKDAQAEKDKKTDKELETKLKMYQQDRFRTTIDALNTIQNVSNINKKLGVFDPRSGDPVIQAVGAEKASGISTIMQYTEQIDALNEKLEDAPDNMKDIYKYAINGLKELIAQTQLYINISKNGLIDETSPLYQNAKRSVSGKPSWMTTQTRTRANPLTGEKENVEIPFGDKLSAQWDETSFGEKAQLITDIGVQTFSTINSAAQFAFDAQIARDQAEIESAKKKEYARIDAMVITSRKAKQLKDKADAETEAKQKELQKKQMKMQIAQLWSTTALGIAGAWAQAFATNAPLWAPIVAGISTAALLVNAGIQTSAIQDNMNSLATGGFVGGTPTGTSMGGDNTRNVNLREGELVLNARDQRNLLKIVKGGGDMSTPISITINGEVTNDSLQLLEDKLYYLQSNGRLSGVF